MLSENIVKEMHESLAVLSPELVPIHQRLVQLRRQLVAIASKEQYPKAELKAVQEELRKIDGCVRLVARLPSIYC